MNSHLSLFQRRSLRYPLARLIVGAVLLAVSVAIFANAVLLLSSARQEIERSLTNAANAAGNAAGAAVLFEDGKAASAVLRMFEVYPEVQAAAVYTLQGKRLARYGEVQLLPSTLAELPDTGEGIGLFAATARLRLPIMIDAAPAGSIYLQARLVSYWRTYLTAIGATLLVTLAAGFVTLLLALRFLDRIIRPLRMLAESAKDARLHKNFTPRQIPAGNDEIGGLVSNFNALLEEVERSRHALEGRKEELEGLVQQRTVELLAAKEQADQANVAKSKFLAAASHDLRQPIHAMRLFLETLGESSLDEEQRRITNYLTISTRNLAEILNALLDVSRLESGMIEAHPEQVSVFDLARQLEYEFAPLAQSKGLRFKLYFPSAALNVYTDPKLLANLLRNLVDNAIKYTPHGGILVGFRYRRDTVLIQVWDTGIGISEEHQRAIFEEYFQVGNPQRDRAQGLGLGLANAKRVANLLGLGIHCHSRLGRGSLFEVEVPLTKVQAGQGLAKLQVAPGKDQPGLAGLRIVVVEDDSMAATAIELALRNHGLHVEIHPTAEQALADANIDQADFYFVDYRLPGMHGADFLNLLQQRAGHAINAALLTGESAQKLSQSGASQQWRVLTKPVETYLLIAEIEGQCLHASG